MLNLFRIYIPLWSYSNGSRTRQRSICQIFTFHYGPIQIENYMHILRRIKSIYIPLWSYSNYERLKRNRKTGCNLHSTMVLFKLTMLEMPRQEESIYIPLWSYSNKTKHRKLSMEYKFTFHYGPIQILFFPSLSSFLLHLHSTMVLFKQFDVNVLASAFNNLHSTMVLFKFIMIFI